MADLRPSVGGNPSDGPAIPGGADTPGDGDARSGERGQLILITGFLIAVTLVALALVMNSAIYTENLATRSESSGATEAVTYQHAFESAAREAFRYAHEVNDSDHAGLERNVTQAVEELSNLTMRQQVVRGVVTNVSVVTTTDGTTLNDSGGDFTDDDGNADWTLANGVDGVRAFRMKVDPSALETLTGDEFRVVASFGSDRWYMNVSENTVTGSTVVGINASGSVDTCVGPSSTFWINVTAGTVAGEECDALTYAEGVPDGHTLTFENASAVSGEYSLVVDGTPESGVWDSSTGPHRDPALYSVTTELVVRTPELEYRSKFRIAPGESDG